MLSTGAIVGIVFGVIGALVIGAVIGYFLATHFFKKQMKKNPPISKDTIRMIYRQVGRTPSEKQVNEIFNKVSKN